MTKGMRKPVTFTSIDGTEWTMQRVPGETEAEFEERARLFEDLSRSNGGRIPIASDLPKSALEKLRKQADEYPAADLELVGAVSYLEIAEMMIAGASLDEILTAHPDADIDAVMSWHKERSGDDLATTYAARQWLRQKRR